MKSIRLLSLAFLTLSWMSPLWWAKPSYASEAKPEILHFSTTEWCPYACGNEGALKGMAYEYLVHIFAKLDIELEVEFYPWSRAIKQVKNGHSHGLLTAIEAEAPELVFSQVPTMTYQVCFYSHITSDWQFQNRASLRNTYLGVIESYGYGEPIDSYVRVRKDNVSKLTGEDGLPRLLNLVLMGRIETLVDDDNAVRWNLRKLSADKRAQVKNTGCLADNPFYLALSPHLPWAKSLLNELDSELKKADNVRFLEKVIRPKYQ